MPRYLGSANGLTGIPSALPSSLAQIQDPNVQKAIYQLQNWSNSFPVFNFGVFNGNYTTGGVTVTWNNPYTVGTPMIVATGLGISPVFFVTINTNGMTSGLFQCWTSTSTEVTNGTHLIFFYLAIGS